MKHYVIINDWSASYENGTNVIAVTHSLEEAKEVFNECLADEKKYAEEHDWYIYDDYETVFDAGEDGDYVKNHTHLFIQTV